MVKELAQSAGSRLAWASYKPVQGDCTGEKWVTEYNVRNLQHFSLLSCVRSPMSTSDLSVFFRPRGVAVIGASGDQEKLGHSIVRNLRNVHYDGPVYPVNPHEDEILGYKAYPTVTGVPDPVELAVIIVPAPVVAAQVEACG